MQISLNEQKLINRPQLFKVSAIVSTYNSEEFMRGCLRDLVEQTLYQQGELEIIIIDSNSRQNEREIVEEFQSNYPNISYERTLETEPLYTAWNRAIAKANGNYITNANTDDRHRFDMLAVMADYLDTHTEIGLVYADQLISTVANDTFATTQAERKWNWPTYTYEQMQRGCCVGSQPMWRKSLHDKHGYFREDFHCCGDYEFWLRLGDRGVQMALIPEILGLYYFNPQGLEHSAPGRAGRECDIICDEYNISRVYVPQISGAERKFSDLQYQGILLTDEEREHLNCIQEHRDQISPTIVVDGVFFQINQTGIARVWRSIFAEWSESGFARHVVVLDRDKTAPRFPGIRYRNIERYNYEKTGLDAQILQFVCDEVAADLFISTYYTTPLSTPSVFMTYDMIPEVIGADLQDPMWREKHYGILHACRYVTISQSTADDLIRFFPTIDPAAVTVALCGVTPDIAPANGEEISKFKIKYQISKSYFLLVGSRLSLDGYKNAALFFKALQQCDDRDRVAIVCIGGEPTLEPELVELAQQTSVYLLRLDDTELSEAYSGAIALIYPSLYEGFGLPIAEAMACGCPVITCRNSSIPEVAGDAAIYVDGYRVDEMAEAIARVQLPDVRQSLIAQGLERVQQFSWAQMAQTIAAVLLTTSEQLHTQQIAHAPSIWTQLRKMQAQLQQPSFPSVPDPMTMPIAAAIANLPTDAVPEELNRLEMQLAHQQQQLQAARDIVISMQSTKFWQLRSVWFRLKPLLLPLVSLVVGLSLLVLANLSFTYSPLVQLVTWFARFQTNNLLAIGVELVAIALMLGIVGYLDYVNAKILRSWRIRLIVGGSILVALSVQNSY